VADSKVGIKLENKALISDEGHEVIATSPYEKRLLGRT